MGRYGSIGMEMAASVLVGVAIGYLIDREIDTIKPMGTLLFTFFGFAAGLKRLLSISKNVGKGEKQE